MLLSSFFYLVSLLATLVVSTGKFLNPAGAQGAITVTEGSYINLSWTNISDYSILSLGYLSASNQTITWLISNSKSHPTSYNWTVDAVEHGFNLTSSPLFYFYICNGTNFGAGFESSYIVVNAKSSSPASSSSSISTSSTATATTTSATQTSSLSSSTTLSIPPTAAAGPVAAPSSSGLSTGAKAGIAIAAVLGGGGAIAGLVACFYFRRRRASKTPTTDTKTNHLGPYANASEVASNSTYDKAHPMSPYAPVHEAPGSQETKNYQTPVEIGHNEPNRFVELPTAER